MADLFAALAELPPQAQALAIVVIGIGFGAYLLYIFISRQKAPDETPRQEQLRVLGAALGDSQALDRLREELRELRATADENARQNIRANELIGDLIDAIKDVAVAIRNQRIPARRR